MTNVIPFSASQAAELVDADAKRFANARARCALLGRALYRHVGADGAVTYSLGLTMFETIDQVEDLLDQLGSDE